MYEIVAIELGAERGAGRRWTVASGFPRLADAAGTLASWVQRHHPGAHYHEPSQLWLIEDESGQVCYFVEFVSVAPSARVEGRKHIAPGISPGRL